MADAPAPHDTVLGFHSCEREFAERLFAGEVSIEDWSLSENPYDWLGDGIYFWENNLRRSMEWAKEMVEGDAAIVEAEISLGKCFDLTTTEDLEQLRLVYERLVGDYKELGRRLPQNRDLRKGAKWQQKWLGWLDRLNSWLYPRLAGTRFERATPRKLRYLDRLVMNEFHIAWDRLWPEGRFQTIRCTFEEGEPVFPGSMIRRQSHVQIAIRDRSCISLRRMHLVP